MNHRFSRFLNVLLMLSISLMCNAAFASSVILPSQDALNQAEQLFAHLFKHNYSQETKALAKTIGFSWHENSKHVHLKDPLKKGIGEYFFHKQPKNEIILQAPHRYHDKYTGTIIKKLFKESGIHSLALNTLPRYSKTKDNIDLDFSRLKNSMHSVYTLAYISQQPRGKVIQIHGFDHKKRRSASARASQIILSNGNTKHTAYLLNLQMCFDQKNWISVRYPDQVNELGATKNPIGILLRSLNTEAFHHIELNLETRQTLAHQSSKRLDFMECLIKGLE